jgi:Ca-activated chloride channel family protein
MKYLIKAPILTVVFSAVLTMAACSNGVKTSEKDEALTVSRPTVEDKSQVPVQPGVEEVIVSGARASGPQRRIDAHKLHKAQEMFAGMAATSYAPGIMTDDIRVASEPLDTEKYAAIETNPVKRVAEHPVSTFSIDVDTGAYSNVRRFLQQGRLPPKDAVRVEEMINYFSYDYQGPANRGQPFSVYTEISTTPWNEKTRLLKVGIKGYAVAKEQLPPANLVFLVDVSGSMESPDKLPLLKSALKMLTQRMSERDFVSLVVYAGASGVVLEPTPGNKTATISAALDRLSAGGSTNGGAGIKLAYAMAKQGFIKGGINRVILATDGDFNVGTVNFESLKQLIEEQRASGIELTTLGFGGGNYNDHLMEQLADAGNGNYAYIDTLNEARKVLVEEMSATLFTIARDVKIQIEFNPAAVAEYRLIGYENRMLKREDFNNDKIDAGDIGAGHTVTALYEIALAGDGGERIEPLRYGVNKPAAGSKEELAFLRLRYKLPGEEQSKLLEQGLLRKDIKKIDQSSDDLRFAASVAAFGQMLRGGEHLGKVSWPEIRQLASNARGDDAFGYRGEFLQLLAMAETLSVTPVN